MNRIIHYKSHETSLGLSNIDYLDQTKLKTFFKGEPLSHIYEEKRICGTLKEKLLEIYSYTLCLNHDFVVIEVIDFETWNIFIFTF